MKAYFSSNKFTNNVLPGVCLVVCIARCFIY